MNKALTIANLVLAHAEDISTFLIVSAFVVAGIIWISEYKEKTWKYITNRRNKWWFIYAALLFAAILFVRIRGYLFGYWLIAVSVSWMIYFIVIIYSLKPKRFTGYGNLILRKYEKWLEDGSSIEHIAFFRKRSHWYFLTAEDKLEYHMLAITYFEDVKEFDNAYRSLEAIKDEWLYEGEKENLKLQRALLLAQMGSMKAAFQILGNPEDNTSSDPMVWFAYSFIYENAGDIDKALLYAEKSRDIVEGGYKILDFVAAEIYNNYSRVAIMKGNRQEALRYLDAAWNFARKSKDMRTVHIVASNRIAQMSMIGKSRAECEAALKEYRALIPNDSFMNKVEYNNAAIYYYRQIKDTQRENDLIKSGFLEVIDHLNHSQRVLYTASTFRMLMNGRFDHRWFDKFVKVKDFEELPVMDKLIAYKEYMGLFQQTEFRAVCNQRPYSGLQRRIMKYYREKAIDDIENELTKVEPNNRFKYLNLMMIKLGILKLIEGKQHIDNSKNIYVDLYKELYDAGLHLDAVRVLQTLVDDCSSPYSILIWRPFWPEAVYYSDFIEGASQPPDPLLDPDGIHLQYFQLQLTKPYAVRPLHDDVIREHIDKIMDEFRSWKNHPFKIDLSIEIAKNLMYLDRKDEAREFYLFFKNSGVSENQMASWIREDIKALETELE